MNAPHRTPRAAASAAATLLLACGAAAAVAAPQAPTPKPSASVPAERLPLGVGSSSFAQTLTRSGTLRPGGARDYVLPLDTGSRFTVGVRGSEGARMRFSVSAPVQDRPLYDAPVRTDPQHFSGVARIAADYTVRVYRAPGAGAPAAARYTLTVVRR